MPPPLIVHMYTYIAVFKKFKVVAQNFFLAYHLSEKYKIDLHAESTRTVARIFICTTVHT